MYQKIKKIVDREEIKKILPSRRAMELKIERDNSVRDIILGKDFRKIVIAGPCSADDENAVVEYCQRLKAIAARTADKLLILPRLFSAKPRSRGGYKGMFHTPILGEEEDFNQGVFAVRKMLVRVLEETGMSGTDELLYPDLIGYFDDILSYMTVGSRSSEDQSHKFAASALTVAVGFKNPPSGSLAALSSSVYVASRENHFILNGEQCKSSGNKYAHGILRGYLDNLDNMHANYDKENVMRYAAIAEKAGINRSLIVDCSHCNSKKKAEASIKVALDVIDLLKDEDYSSTVKGIMLESYINNGCQTNREIYGKSITDECISIEQTEKIIMELYSALKIGG